MYTWVLCAFYVYKYMYIYIIFGFKKGLMDVPIFPWLMRD